MITNAEESPSFQLLPDLLMKNSASFRFFVGKSFTRLLCHSMLMNMDFLRCAGKDL